MTGSRGYRRSADLAEERAADGPLYVMSLPDGIPRALNGSAEAIWEAVVSGSEQILQVVAEAFDVDPDDIAGDVEATVQSFVELGFIEPVGDDQQ